MFHFYVYICESLVEFFVCTVLTQKQTRKQNKYETEQWKQKNDELNVFKISKTANSNDTRV